MPAGVLVLLGLIAFGRAYWNGWTGWDDTAYVVNNAHMTVPGGLARVWTTGESEQFYPLTFTSYWLQFRLFGESAGGYHAVNTLLHVTNGVLLLALLRALGLARGAAVGAAALFVVHPTQVMSVAWIAEHKNVLAGFFSLLSMLAWVRRGNGWGAWYVVSLVCFALAMLSKTAVLGLPISLLLLDHCVRGVAWRAGVARAIPALLIAAALAMTTLAFEQKFVDKSSPEWMPGLLERVQIAGAAPWVYVWHLVWPARLSPAYELWSVGGLVWWLPLIASVAAGAGLLVLWAKGRVRGVWVWGCAHFVLMLGPTLGLIPFGNLAVTHVSDHFLYLASFGLFVPVATTLDTRLTGGVRTGAGWIAVAIIGVLTFISWRDVGVYRDAISMWTRGVEIAPDNYTARLGLAEGLSKGGRREEALPHYAKATEIRPRWPDAWMFLGGAQLVTRDLAGAEQSLTRALEFGPGNVQAMSDLASVLEQTGRLEPALALYERAVGTDGAHLASRLGLAKMYLGFARYDDALIQFREVVRMRGDLGWGHLGAATCLRSLRRDAEAVTALREGLRLIPDDPPLINMLARILATSREDNVRNAKEAMDLAQRVNAGAQWQNPLLLDTFAAALAESGMAAEAADASLKAAELHERMGNQRGAQRSAELAERYKAGETLRE